MDVVSEEPKIAKWIVRGVITKHCRECSSAFTTPASREWRNHYCSIECSSASARRQTEAVLAMVKLDPDDLELVRRYTWGIDGNGYVKSSSAEIGKTRIHRFLMGLENGDKRMVDHINGDRLDNRRENLRVCVAGDNLKNCRKRRDGLKGVYWSRRAGKWAAQITFDYEKKYLGLFDTEAEAHEAYRIAALKYHGEFANFGDGSVLIGG